MARLCAPVCQGYLGTPPSCRPECTVSSDCPRSQACNNQKCIDPCSGTCGLKALCQVVNHNPVCSCSEGFTGDPFTRCDFVRKDLLFFRRILFAATKIGEIHLLSPLVTPAVRVPSEDTCASCQCGPNSIYQTINDKPSCACLPDFIGSPPNCRPECVSNSECSSNLACINRKCQDPCPGSCAPNAECRVVSHTPMCACLGGYTGDPFTQCNLKQRKLQHRYT